MNLGSDHGLPHRRVGDHEPGGRLMRGGTTVGP
jgi:hypothetical protein